MIATVTFNPSLDYILQVPEVISGATNRAAKTILLAGGKGINVSLVLGNLSINNKAYGFIGGFTGTEIKRQLKKAGCDYDFIELPNALSRINIKIKSQEETEINAPGPHISPDNYNQLLTKLDKLSSDDTLVLSGSIPPSIPGNVYDDIIGRISPKGCRIVVDTSQGLLSSVLKYKPFLIKPNLSELAEICGKSAIMENGYPCLDTVKNQAQQLLEQGVQNVLVSMGRFGAVLLTTAGDIFLARAPKGKLVNSVGAGDSMVAGFLAGIETSPNDVEHALRLSVAAGSASAFSMMLATKKQAFSLMDRIKITTIS